MSKQRKNQQNKPYYNAYSASIEEDTNILTPDQIDELVEDREEPVEEPVKEEPKQIPKRKLKTNEIKDKKRVTSSNPDWNRILNAYYENPRKPDFSGYVIAVKKRNDKTILTWNGKSVEV